MLLRFMAPLGWREWVFFSFFRCGPFFKVFIEFVTILVLFYVSVFGSRAYGILALWPGIESEPPVLEDDVLTTGPPGKSLEWISIKYNYSWASLVAQMVKNLPAMQETRVQSLGWENPLEEGTATHSSILAGMIPWTEETGGLQSMGSQRVGHNWATNTFTHFTIILILSYILISLFPIYGFHLEDSPLLSILYQHFPVLSWLNFSTERFGGSRKESGVLYRVAVLISSLRPVHRPLWCLLSARETKWGSFSFSLSSFFKPDNFLQLTWDLILTSWSFTCFDILEIEMSVRWTLSRVWSDITQGFTKTMISLAWLFAVEGGLNRGVPPPVCPPVERRDLEVWALAQLCTCSLPFAFSASVSLSVKQSDRSLFN